MNAKLLRDYRKIYEQAFMPIFVHDDFDTQTLIEGCKLAGVGAIEYTLRRPDANTVLPTLKEKMQGVSVLVGSTIDCDKVILQMRTKNPQLMTIDKVAPFVDGLVSMLPYSNETIKKYKDSHILVPTAQTSGEALRQIDSGATFIKVCGPDFSFSKSLHAAPTFNYCPTFITGGVTIERMREAYEAGNVLTAAGFDLILKGEDAKTLTKERVCEKLLEFINAAKKARAEVYPQLKDIEKMTDDEFIASLPNYFSL